MEMLPALLGDWAGLVSTILTGLLAAHALAVFVVNLTPTPADDAAVATVYSWIEKLAGIITPKAKQ